jgi:outer membrane protein
MRFIVRGALGALAFATFAAGSAAAQAPKIAYVDSRRILAKAPGASEAQSSLSKDAQSYQTQVQQMGDSLNALIAEYNKQEPSLSPAAKEGKQKEIRDREQQYQQRAQQFQQEMQQKQEQLIKPIMDKIDKVIEQLRAEGGYAMIFDVGNQGNAIVAADTTLDITEKVIARLQATGGVAKQPAKPTSGTGATSKPTGVSRPKNPPRDR